MIVTLVEMLKRYMQVPHRVPSKNDITVKEALHMKYIDIELVYLTMCGKFRRSYFKMGDSKKNAVNIKQGINIAIYTWRRNLP